MSRELQALNTHSKLQQWMAQVADCRNSSLTVRDWCREHDVCPQTYYKWQRRVYEYAKSQQPQFAEVATPGRESCKRPVATLKSGGMEADIYSGIEKETLELLCGIMRHAE